MEIQQDIKFWIQSFVLKWIETLLSFYIYVSNISIWNRSTKTIVFVWRLPVFLCEMSKLYLVLVFLNYTVLCLGFLFSLWYLRTLCNLKFFIFLNSGESFALLFQICFHYYFSLLLESFFCRSWHIYFYLPYILIFPFSFFSSPIFFFREFLNMF